MTNLEEGVELIKEDQLSKEQRKAVKLVIEKKKNLFIQGMAGSGKSAFIKYLQSHSAKNIVLCSPTAIAALNIGGVTLHSLFKLPIMSFITDEQLFRMNRKTVWSVIKAIDILIIDEVSMVRPDVLDAVDKVCKRIRRNTKAFGGIQVVLIGDLYQLPPVINSEAKHIFEAIYGTDDPYFFDSDIYKSTKFEHIEFSKVFRQQDDKLLKHLIHIRTNKNIESALKYFNKNEIKNKTKFKNAVTITPYRAIADSINKKNLAKLKTKAYTFTAQLSGTFEKFSETSYPAAKDLALKEGALVIFNKNDTDKNWVNGTVGIIDHIESEFIYVKKLPSEEIVCVERETWEDKKYDVELNQIYNIEKDVFEEKEKIIETITGQFKQFPLQLGYAMTIHKAQGKTLDAVNIDLDRGTFAPGQLYVALSRTRRKEDMNIISEITKNDIIFDKRVQEFLEN